jgi:large subunit ribosomal protein L32e
MEVKRKNKPKFNVPNLGFFKSVKARWRKPRGTHNKKRMKASFMGASPKIGYRNPPEIRGLHPSGMKEVLVNSVKEIEGLKDVVVRIAASVGGKKRAIIEEKAKALHIRIINMAPAKDAPKPEWKAKVHTKEGRKEAKGVVQAHKASAKAESAHKAAKPAEKHVHKAK